MRIDWFDKLRHMVQTLAFCLTISALQYAVQPEKPYVLPLVYSLCIGLWTWLIMDFGRHLFPSAREHGWPKGWGIFALPTMGIVGGYLAGTFSGDLWFGWSSWDSDPYARAQLPFSIVVTGVAGVVASFYFYITNKAAILEAKVEEVSRQSSEAKLRLLESQLEPHMLFNTLANLRVLIGTDPPRATAMLDRLNDFLRATLQASRSVSHTLQAEFDRLDDYLQLMQVRMGARLRYTLTLPPELAGQPIPPLLLQPLVENAIQHGLEPQVAGGEVRVSARADAQALHLRVEDTGGGLASGAPTAGTGFGVQQVRERLATAYGPQATIDLIACHADGTRADITIPLNNGV